MAIGAVPAHPERHPSHVPSHHSRVGGRRIAMRNETHPPRAERVSRVATRQHGVVSNDQLRSLGLDRCAIRRRVASGYLHRIHHGVYLVGHRTLTKRAKYFAAVLACGPHAALSHRSAADHWDLWARSGRPSVVVPHGRRALPRAIDVHRSRMLTPLDVTCAGST